MEDTSTGNYALARETVMSKSVEERFLMCAQEYESTKSWTRWLVMSTGLPEEEQEACVFERLHGAYPEEFVKYEWLRIVYSAFWDYPFGIAVEYEGDVYIFLRGGFDEELDDYPSEFEIIRDNSIDMSSMRNNFTYDGTGEVVGRIDMRELHFDPSHRQYISSKVFIDLGLGKTEL